jgi:hypothetical protein
MEFTEEQSKRFWAKVNKKADDECWEWTAAKSSKGYGQFALNKIAKSTHRISYIIHKGEIPDGLMICHTCNNPPCINPNHLYAGTSSDNMEQSVREMRHHEQSKTHCKNGHEFTEENTFLRVRKGRGITRVCRECKRKSDRQRVKATRSTLGE